MTAGRIVPVVLAALGLGLLATLGSPPAPEPIRVGVLHSLTGTMATSERPVVDATLLAIEEVNQAGGILGRQVEAVVVDGQSRPEVFAAEAERLISADGVKAIFGCWTSASRKLVKSVVERHRHLLFYPVQYEGLEQSPFIVYMGAAPNQQLNVAVHFGFDSFGSRFFLVGSDYVFPRAVNAIIRDQVEAQGGGVIAGEEYVPLGGEDFSAAVAAIARTRPDVIINTINGDSNRAFFRALRAAGVSSKDVPTISLSVDENVVQEIGPAVLAGDYAVWSYFQSVDSDANRRFIERFRARFGANRPTSDAMQAAYSGVHLWAQTVAETRSDDIDLVRDTLGNQSVEAPGGVIFVDPETRHTWKNVHVAEIRPDGGFEIVWTSDYPIQPVPFPPSRPRAAWEDLLASLNRRWQGHWAAPGASS